MPSPRLLLLEFLQADIFSQYRSEFFPFLRAYAEAQGVAVEWLAFGMPAERAETERFVPTLSVSDCALLSHRLGEFLPTHVVSNEHMGATVRAVLDAHDPTGKVTTTERGALDANSVGAIHDWLGLDGIESGLLIDAVEPNYYCSLANNAAKGLRPFVQLLAGPACSYQRPLTRNPYYASLGDRARDMSSACAFCESATSEKYSYATAPLELVMKQLRAAVRTSPPDRPAGRYLVQGAAPFFLLGRFVDQLLEEGFPPSEFLFACRVDELLRMRATIERVLPRMDEAGHSLQIHNISVENFSEAENARLNKGISADQVVEAAECMRRWETTFPRAFGFSRFGGFGFITFTPWTRLDDLEVNLHYAQKVGLAFGALFATSRLMLLHGRPITELARQDDLVASTFEDPCVAAMVEGGALHSFDQAEVPWRFAHAEVGRIYALLIRVGDGPSARFDDALTLTVRKALEHLPRSAHNPHTMMPALVRAARALPDASAEELLHSAIAQLVHDVGEAHVESGERGLWTKRAKVAKRVLDCLAAGPSRPMGGFYAESVEAEVNGLGEMVVTLRRGDDQIELAVRAPRGFDSPYLRTARFAFSYRGTTSVDTLEKHAVVRLVAAALDRFVVHAGETP